MVIWLIGKSGSGKTFYGKKLLTMIKKTKKIHLEGDEIRRFISSDLGYSIKDRKINSLRIINLCKYLENKNYFVICSILSIFREHQIKNRSYFSKYLQIFIDANEKTILKRDIKNIYLNKKNVVGKDIKFNKPYKSDLTIKAEEPYKKNLNKIINLINES